MRHNLTRALLSTQISPPFGTVLRTLLECFVSCLQRLRCAAVNTLALPTQKTAIRRRHTIGWQGEGTRRRHTAARVQRFPYAFCVCFVLCYDFGRKMATFFSVKLMTRPQVNFFGTNDTVLVVTRADGISCLLQTPTVDRREAVKYAP